MLRKRIFGIISIVLALFLLQACSKKEYKVTRNYYLEDVNAYGSYLPLANFTSIFKNKPAKDDSYDAVNEDVNEDYLTANFDIGNIKTNHNIKAREYVYNIYFNLKSFAITYEINGEVKTTNKTYKYLTNLNLQDAISNLPENNIWLVKSSNNKEIITKNITVTRNLHLVLLNDFLLDENYNTVKSLQNVSQYLKILLSDDALKDASAYPEGYKVVKNNDYKKLINSYNDAINALLSRNKTNDFFASLQVAYNECINTNIIGTKKTSDYVQSINQTILKQTFDKVADELTKKYNNSDKLFKQIIKLPSNGSLSNYYVSTKTLDEENFNGFERYLNNIKKEIAYLTFNDKDVIKTKQNLIKLQNILDNFDSSIQKYTSEIKVGEKSELVNYKVIVYLDGVKKSEVINQGEKYSTVILTPTEDTFKNLYPSFNSSLKLELDSKLTVVLSDENQEIVVKFKTKTLKLAIDLGGGVSEYDKNYIEVTYNTILDETIKNKLINITKQNDQYGTNYTFKEFVNAYDTDEVINLNSPITKECILKATYTFSKKTFNYKIHIYYDVITKKTTEPVYLNSSDEILTSVNTVTSGDIVYYTPTEKEGFVIDKDRSVLFYGKIGETDIIKVYYKRNLYLVKFVIQDGGQIIDSRVVNNASTVKFGTVFDFIPETIKYQVPVSEGVNKTFIFDKLIDANTGLDYDMEQQIKSNLILEVVTKEVSEFVTITFYPNKLGKEKQKGDKNISLAQYLYIEKNSKITSPSFYLNFCDANEASFDSNNGFIRNNKNEIVSKDTVYDSDTTLSFVYNVTLKQLDDILAEQFPRFLGKDTEREITGQIVYQINNKQYVLSTSQGSILVITDNLPINFLALGAKYRLSGTVIKDTNEFGTDLTDHNYFRQINVGRYADYVLTVTDQSNVVLTEPASGSFAEDIKVFTTIKDTPTLSKVNVNNFLITNVYNKKVYNISLYDKIDGYYQYRGVLENGEVCYVVFPFNARNLDLLLGLNAGDTIDLSQALYMNFRVKRDGLNDFRDGAHKHFPTFYIEEYNGKVSYVENTIVNKQVKVIFNLEFITYPNLPIHKNKSFEFIVNNNTTLKAITKELLENNVFNGYAPSVFKIGDNIVSDTDKFNEDTTINVTMARASNIINFIWGTYAPHYVLKDNLELTANFGRKKYTTSYIDYDNGFYKFVLSYDPEDEYIKVDLNINNEKKRNIVIDLSLNKTSGERTFVTFDAGRYSPVYREFGSPTNKFFEYSWAAQHPYEIGKRKGFFVTAFGIKKDVLKDDNTKVDTLEEFSDGLFYSRIMIQNTGTYNKEGDFNINKDWNMHPTYTKYDGHLFYDFDESLTAEQIKLSNKIDIRAFATMCINDYDKDGKLFRTNDRVRFNFHRDSLHKLVTFNRFGVGVVNVDLSPYITENGKDYIITHLSTMTSTLLPEMQQPNKPINISTNNSRVFASKEAFLNYLHENNVPVERNTDGTNSPQTLARLYEKYTFNLVNVPSTITFKNNLQSIDLMHYKGENNQIENLSLLNIGDNLVYFSPKGTNYFVHLSDLFKSEKTEYNVYVLAPKQVDILVVSKDLKVNGNLIIPQLNFGLPGYEETITGTRVPYSATPLKKDNVYKFTISIPQTNNLLYLPFKLNAHLVQDGKVNTDLSFSIPFYTKVNTPSYIYFETSNKLIVTKSPRSLVVLLTDSSINSFNTDFNNAYLKYNVNNVEKNLYTKVRVLDNVVAFVVDNVEGEPTKIVPYLGSQQLYTNSNGLENRFDRKGNNHISFTVVDCGRDPKKSYTLSEVFNSSDALYNNTRIRLIKHWLSDENNIPTDLVTDYIVRKPSLDYPVDISSLLPTDTSKYEIFYTTKDLLNNKISFNPKVPLTEPVRDLVIHAYYKAKTNPEKTAKISIDFNKIGYSEELDDQLLFNYYYQERGAGQLIKLPKNLNLSVVVLDNLIDKYTYRELQVDGSVIDINSYIVSSSIVNVTVKYNDNVSKGIVTIDTYLENNKIKTEQLVANVGASYQLNTLSVVVPSGYEIDNARSVLKIPNVKPVNNYLKIYLKPLSNLFVKLDLNGGELEENDITHTLKLKLKNSFGFNISGGSYFTSSARYNTNILKFEIIKLLTDCAPIKDGKHALAIRFILNNEEYVLSKFDRSIMEKLNITHDIDIEFCYE